VNRVVVLTATDVEARGLARHLGLSSVAGSDHARFCAGVLEVVCVGLGARHLDARAARFPRSAWLVSAGTCAALAPGLAEGDLVVPEVVVDGEGTRHATAEVPGLRRSGSLLAVDAVVTTPQDKARLWLATGSIACDMESGVILGWAAARGMAAGVIRAVSDPATRGLPADLAAVVEPDGRVRTARAVRAALARPRAVADALVLRRGTSAALRSVARALAGLARTVA